MSGRFYLLACAAMALISLAATGLASDALPLLHQADFEAGAEAWQPTDPAAWEVKSVDGGHVYSQFKKRSQYEPPHRSPYNVSILKDLHVGDLVLEAKVRSTHPDYGHRDACLFFGYQDSAHFYYVHLGQKTDDHANQIFIVNGAPRIKISQKTTPGTPWDDQWHQVKVVRKTSDGTIEVYFDDMDKPVMTAQDKTFLWGQIGVGSFDDTSDWDNVRVRGKRVEPTRP